MQWNMKGYFNNYEELLILLKNNNIHVACLQETHLPSKFAPKAHGNYKSYFHNHPSIDTRKQGIGILIKNNLPHTVTYFNNAILAIAIKINITSPVTIINIYIPPSQSFSLHELTSILNSQNTPILLVGDVNAWSTLWGSKTSNKRGKIFEDLILDSDLIVLNHNSPTHFSTHKTFTNVDISLCSAQLAPFCSWSILDSLCGSDHFPIITSLQTNLPTKQSYPVKYLADRADWEKFKTECELTLTKVPASSNINKEAAIILKAIRGAANKSMPRTRTQNAGKRLPWWNSVIAELRHSKQQAWHRYKRNLNNENLMEYKKANALFRKEVKASKRASFEKFTGEINPLSSSKKVWRGINKLSGNPGSININLIQSPAGALSNQSEIANYLVETWAAYSANQNFDATFLDHKRTLLAENIRQTTNLCPNALEIEKPISLFEFHGTITNATSRSAGTDKISYDIIKKLPTMAVDRILNLYNNIFEKGVYPQHWKTALIIPIPKSNDELDQISGYRPISLLSCTGKILEKIIAKRLAWFANKNGLLSSKQVAFKKGQGTSDLFLLFDSFTVDSLRQRNHVSVLNIDFEKAFDRIGAHVVLNYLNKWKVGPKIYNFVRSFLCNRKIKVRIGTSTSLTKPLENGIPQGSPLSVVLFSIAFNEVSSIINTDKTLQHGIYADDVFVYTKSKNLNCVNDAFQSILEKLVNWSKFSGAKISYRKCSTLHICRKKKCPGLRLTFSGTAIQNVSSCRILGIIFDSKYRFKDHCNYIRKSLITRLNIIKFLSANKSFVHPKTLLMASKALIHSKIDYGLMIYGHCATSTLNMLKAPYHTAIRRSIRAFPTTPTENLLLESGLPTLPQRVRIKTFAMLPKIFYGQNKDLRSLACKIQKRSRKYKFNCIVSKCVEFASSLDAQLKPRQPLKSPSPISGLPDNMFDKSLSIHRKSLMCPASYNKLFQEAIASYTANEFEVIYTDGSKSEHATAFAAVEDNGKVISSSLLLDHCSIFTAEASAILKAAEFVISNRKKALICTDSMSVFKAIQSSNENSHIISTIKQLLHKNTSRIKIMWIPGHSNISGNELADAAAKETIHYPTFLFRTYEMNDLKRAIFHKLNGDLKKPAGNAYYNGINPEGKMATYPPTLTAPVIKPFSRLRLGHTTLTHQHILKGLPKENLCQFCRKTPVTIRHILDECELFANARKQIFGCIPPSGLLKDYSPVNVTKIFQYLKNTDLLRLI